MKSLTRVYLTSRVTTASTTATISNDNRGNVASFTGESAVLATADLKTFEMVQVTASAGTLTFTKRGLDNSGTLTEVSGNKKERGPGTRVYLTSLAFNVFDTQSQSTQSFNGNINFSGTYTFTGNTTFSGNQTYTGNQSFDKVSVANKLTIPQFANSSERDVAYLSPTNGDICIVGGDIQHYNAGTAQWEVADTGTPTPNATDTLAGKVKVATAGEFSAGTDSGGGVYNMPAISQIKGFIQQWEQEIYVAGEDLIKGQALCILGSDGKAYKTKADDITKISFIGFADNTVSSGGNVYVNKNFDNNQTSLTKGALYFASDTAGTISTTVGTYECSIGIATTTTSIEVSKSGMIGPYYATIGAGTQDVYIPLRLGKTFNIGIRITTETQDSGSPDYYGKIGLVDFSGIIKYGQLKYIPFGTMYTSGMNFGNIGLANTYKDTTVKGMPLYSTANISVKTTLTTGTAFALNSSAQVVVNSIEFINGHLKLNITNASSMYIRLGNGIFY